jgi:hypothetical protein
MPGLNETHTRAHHPAATVSAETDGNQMLLGAIEALPHVCGARRTKPDDHRDEKRHRPSGASIGMARGSGHPRRCSAAPPLGELLKPFVTEAVFLVLCTSFLRVNLGSLRDYLRRPGSCSGRERMDHGGRALDRGRGYGVFRRTAIGSREENASIRTAEPGH